VSLNEAPLSSKDPLQGSASIPGKIFVLGEYAVLADRPAIVATLGPRFHMSHSRSEVEPVSVDIPALHPRSPAGRLLAWARERGLPELQHSFVDPHQGAGGFGASTAQFALVYQKYSRLAGFEASAMGARKLYRELMQDEALVPSGADLVAQWSGGVICFDPGEATIRSFWRQFGWQDLLVFSASHRKVATHDHLAGLADGGFSIARDSALISSLDEVVRHVIAAPQDQASLGQALNEYADLLYQAGLELEAAHADREALSALPDVLGVKGTGALLADAVVVLIAPDAPREMIIEKARSRGLKLIADGLEEQAGVLCANA
jgi:mevalonate kinase